MSEQSNSRIVKMRVNITGFGGKAVTLYAAFDQSNDVLLVAQEAKEYDQSERPTMLRITNQDRDKHYDALFTDDETRDAIVAFLELDGLGLLNLATTVQRFNPSHKIEKEGLDANGMKYRIQPDVTNGQVAVLVACLYAQKQRGVGSVADFMEEMNDILTI